MKARPNETVAILLAVAIDAPMVAGMVASATGADLFAHDGALHALLPWLHACAVIGMIGQLAWAVAIARSGALQSGSATLRSIGWWLAGMAGMGMIVPAALPAGAVTSGISAACMVGVSVLSVLAHTDASHHAVGVQKQGVGEAFGGLHGSIPPPPPDIAQMVAGLVAAEIRQRDGLHALQRQAAATESVAEALHATPAALSGVASDRAVPASTLRSRERRARLRASATNAA